MSTGLLILLVLAAILAVSFVLFAGWLHIHRVNAQRDGLRVVFAAETWPTMLTAMPDVALRIMGLRAYRVWIVGGNEGLLLMRPPDHYAPRASFRTTMKGGYMVRYRVDTGGWPPPFIYVVQLGRRRRVWLHIPPDEV